MIRRVVEKMASKADNSSSMENPNDSGSMDKEIITSLEGINGTSQQQHQQRVPPTYTYSTSLEQNSRCRDGEHDRGLENSLRNQATEDQLGPLPINWEKAYTDTGEAYFIDHNTGTSHWLDPRLSKFQKRSLEECLDDELPYGWEKIDDTLYGTYFIDHVNRRTQYENPVLQAKRAQQNTSERKSPNFTRNPDKLKGQRIRTTLVKSSRGLGFTIVGGDDSVQEFLQIKSVVPNGPAWHDGKLLTGDVLVYVNDTCVLGFTHNEMVNVFKSISSGETVNLEVCRGYPLPFDPNDPNTEVVTTIAVNAPDILTEEPNLYMDLDPSVLRPSERFDFLDSSFMPVHSQNGENLTATASVNSMPDLCISEKLNSINSIKRPSSTDILLSDSETGDRKDTHSPVSSKPPEFLNIAVVKGVMGFGFTIADSANGQKVKKILDRLRCKNLMEGDILVSINDVNVRNMTHAEVVQVLKDCPRNREALIHVQRSMAKSPKPFQLEDGREKEKKSPLDFFRSKTPTADIYSTQTKTIVPSRPKTPLIDTRSSNRPKSRSPPPTELENELSNQLDNRFKFADYNHGIYGYSEQFRDNFATMTNLDTNDSLRDVIKREDWLANSDKLNFGGDLYSVHVLNSQRNATQNGGLQSNDYYKDLYGVQSPAHLQYAEQDYNSYSAIGQEQNVDTGEIWDKRKETTSFEHEQPHSSSVVPRFMSYGGNIGNELVCPMIPDVEWIETLVTLVRQDSGFGFRIVGGTEEGSQVSVGHIVPGGAADLDNRLNTGDLIMSVDGESVMNSSHHRVVQLMIAAAQNGRVTLGIRRRIHTQEHHTRDNVQSSSSSSYGCRQMNHLQYPYDVSVTRMENEGFGFVIISSVNKAGSTIGRIIESSPAERCGRLNVGDHILAVNHVDITNVCHKDIVNLIKDSGYSVTLTIGYPLDDCCSSTSMSQKDEPTGDGDGGQYHAVELTRGTRGFGFSIRGGREFQNMPLFVLQIADNGPAAIDNRLRVGDQIIEINGINTKNMTHTEAIEIIRNGGPTVRILVRRGLQIPSVNSDRNGRGANRPIDGGAARSKMRSRLSLICCCFRSSQH